MVHLHYTHQRDGGTRYTAQIRIKRDGAHVHAESATFAWRSLDAAWLRRRLAIAARAASLRALRASP
jgi:hypothetical protein